MVLITIRLYIYNLMFDLVPYVVKFTLDVFVFLALLGNFVLFFSKVYFEVICSTCI